MELRPFLLLLLLLFLLIQFPVFRGCHEDERTALLSFSSSLNDPSGRLSSWQGQNCCAWHGIQCSESFHVVMVDLRNPNPEKFYRDINSELIPAASSKGATAINGTISPSLFTLRHLEHLDLSFNNFHFSKIPPQLANLRSLSYLNLANSNFSDSITTQFTNLSSLLYLDISCSFRISDYSSHSYDFSSSKASVSYKNSYISTSKVSSTNLSWLRGLVNLVELRLSGVDLSVASSVMNWAEPVSFLSDLRMLHLSDCRISGPIPNYEFLNLSRLSDLRMESNSLNSPIPIQLANLTSLSLLDLTNCHLQGSIIHLPQVQKLNVGVNPDLIVNLTLMFALPWPNLKKLYISSTNATGSIPPSISNASLLVRLSAASCLIQGSIPASISNLSNLQYLDLSYNDITGYLPSTISNLKNLQHLKLFQNKLEGNITESICEISSLQFLHLGSNKFIGSLPVCIKKLTNLQVFNVRDNSMEGTVSLFSLFQKSNPNTIKLGWSGVTVETDPYPFPSNFQPKTIDLESCKLNGYIPAFICNLTQLVSLTLASNNLTGSIPSCLFKFPNLSYLDLSHNNLHGILPHSLHLDLSFTIPTLHFARNNLHGPLPLPPENVEVLNLSQNKFTGGIPSQIGERLSKARYVSFSRNKLSGSIPPSICSPGNALKTLDLSDNTLSGAIPSSVENCNSLIFLNLGANNLTGNVPNELGKAKNLKALQLHDNNLSGSFPSFIGQLQDLRVLNLGNNSFEGSIPSFIGKLQNLQILVLRSNSFNKSIPKEIICLKKLQILDLASNKLSGPIPDTIGNLEMLTSRPKNRSLIGFEISLMYAGVKLEMVTKRTMQQFDLVFSYDSGIDLSCNFLVGNIPQEMGRLKGLYMLNLSHNRLSNEIPGSLGNMAGLESLDLSFNNLTGKIPQTVTFLDFLSSLNLSYNNLSGWVPTGLHFDTLSLDGSAFVGNTLLCGPPTRKSCEQGDSSRDASVEEEDKEDVREKLLFYGVVFLGYGVGFWGLFLVLAVKKEKWWFGYWRVIDNVALRIVRCMKKI